MANEATVGVPAGEVVRVELGAAAPQVRCRRLDDINFEFDRSFIIPERAVDLFRSLAGHARQFATRQILVVGHTDTKGPPAFNLALSRRRGQSAFALLTGRESDWLAMFREENSPTRKWGNREARWMLRFLEDATGTVYFTGTADDEGPASDAAIRRYQTDQGLTVDGDAGEDTHRAMFNSFVAMLQADNIRIDASRFLRSTGRNEPWLGCGEEHLAVPTPDETREEGNRRVEFLLFLTPPTPVDCTQYDPAWKDLCLRTELITVEVEIRDERNDPLRTEFFLTSPDGDLIRDVTDAAGLWSSPPESMPPGLYRLRVADREVTLVR